jgi:hypothetical protein
MYIAESIHKKNELSNLHRFQSAYGKKMMTEVG